jgi:hypothetical protein
MGLDVKAGRTWSGGRAVISTGKLVAGSAARAPDPSASRANSVPDRKPESY